MPHPTSGSSSSVHGARPSFASARLVCRSNSVKHERHSSRVCSSSSVASARFMCCSNSVEHQHSSRSVLERSSSSVSGSVAYREVHHAAQDPHRDAVRHRLQTAGHTATPHTTHSPIDGVVAGGHSKATRCPRRWYITMIPSVLSIPSRRMELAAGARPRGARLV